MTLPRRRRPTAAGPLLVPVLLALAASPGMLSAAPQTFNTALPVAEGQFIYRQQFLHREASGDPGPADRDLRVTGGVAVLGYGVTPRLSLFGAAPWLDKRLSRRAADGSRLRRTTRGFGDARLFARYTLFVDDAPGRTFRVAAFAGVEAPTGRDGDRDRLGRLPQPLQAGSGSWGPFAGVVTTWQTLDFQIDAQAAYENNRRANDFEFGDELRVDAAFQFRLWPRELGPGVPGFVFGAVEVNFSRRGRNRFGGEADPDSGGKRLFIAPGLQYVTRRWIGEAVVQIPVVQALNGAALEDDFTVRLGIRVNL